MLQVLNALQLLLYIGLLALVGQAILFVLSGAKRNKNLFYQLFQVLNKPWVGLARLVSPKRVAPEHVPFVAFFMVGVTYMAVTLAKIEHCVSIGIKACQ